MIKSNSYIIVHAGRRDDYQIALALEENNQLFYLVTESYFPLDNYFFNKLVSFIGLKNKFSLRYKQGVPSKKVLVSYKAFFFELLFHLTKNVYFDKRKGEILGLKAKKISMKHNIPIIAVNTCAYDAFFKNPIQPKVLFQFHPHVNFVKNIFEEEIRLNPLSKRSLIQEYEYSLSKKAIERLKNEIGLSSHYICASSVTKKSLESQKVRPNDIKVIPYGVDVSQFKYVKREEDTLFNIIFIGSLNQRKGITYLLEGLSEMSNVSLTIVGRGIFDENLLSGYNFPIQIFKNVNQKILIEKLQNAHCFVLPSILEGFGQVILEAMATGIPVIATENTAAADIITNHKDGFVVPIRDTKSITTIIAKLQTNFNLVNSIGLEANITAQKYNWETFRANFVEHLNSIKE